MPIARVITPLTASATRIPKLVASGAFRVSSRTNMLRTMRK